MKQVHSTGTNAPGTGAPGFGERELPPPDDPQLALGYVTGVRMFDFGGPAPRGRHFLGSDQVGELTGNYGGRWADGEVEAVCKNGHMHADQVPSASCGCGFWAYWTADDAARVWRPTRPVMGVVEGYGPTRIGDVGFRSKLARIVALAIVFDFHTEIADGPTRDGWTEIVPAAPMDSRKNHELLAMAEDTLGERYPSARIYSTTAAMLATHPTSTEYLPNTARRERWPGAARPNMPTISTAEAMARMQLIKDVYAAGGITIEQARQAIEAMQLDAYQWGGLITPAPPAHRLMPCQRCGNHAARVGQSMCEPCQARIRMMNDRYWMPSLARVPVNWPGRIINC